jgi:hypothetical protein
LAEHGHGDYSGNFNDPHSWGWPFFEDGCDAPISKWPELRPYAKDDRLWVRESYFQRGHWQPVEGVKTKGGRQKWAFVPADGQISFDAPAEYRKGRHTADPETVAWHKRLGRFMPRCASRLTLTVTDVRVERLQNISEADARAEGLQYQMDWLPQWRGADQLPWRSEFPRDAFRDLWDSINGNRKGASWTDNPWVVAISFAAAQRNIDHG